MYSFEYTPLHNFTGIKFLPNQSLKRELKLPFKLLINCSFMKINENLKFKTIQEMVKHNFQKLNAFTELNSKFKSKNLIYSFQEYTKMRDHFAAPIQLQILSEKSWNTNFSCKRTFNIPISSLMRRKNYSEFPHEKFNKLHATVFFSSYLPLNT